MSSGPKEGTLKKKCTFLTIGFPSKCLNCLGDKQSASESVLGSGWQGWARDLRHEDQADARAKIGQIAQGKHPPEGQVARWSQSPGPRQKYDPIISLGMGFRHGDLVLVFPGPPLGSALMSFRAVGLELKSFNFPNPIHLYVGYFLNFK